MSISIPADIAAQALGIDIGSIDAVEPIKHGLTNESWLVRAHCDAVVVRVSNAAEDELRIDRSSEVRVLAAVAQAGIGPQVLLCDPARHVLVTRYLGRTWTQDEACHGENIRRLASLLQRLHRLAVPPGVREVDLASTVQGYLHTLDEHDVHGSLTTRPVRERSRQIAAELREGSHGCLCHNDVHHLNVVSGKRMADSGWRMAKARERESFPAAANDGGLRLIDWEYAGVGEPLFDLASLCVYHRYDTSQRELLLSTYVTQPDPPAWHRLELACWLFDYVRELWLAVREITSCSASAAPLPRPRP